MRKGEGITNYDREHEGDQPPYPGVIIEEMIDSASMIGVPDDGKSFHKIENQQVSPFSHFVNLNGQVYK